MDLTEGLRTTGAVREFSADRLDDATLYRLLDTARFAPNGGNRQAWRVIIVKDADLRRSIRDCYLSGWYDYLAQRGAGLTPWAVPNDRAAEREAIAGAGAIARAAADGPGGFAEHIDEVPAMLVLLADLTELATVDRDADGYTMVGGASIYPFAWSILLASHADGLGGVMTTVAVREADALRRILRIPDTVAIAAVIALGTPVHRPTRLRRDPVEDFATVDRFDGPSLEPG